MNQRTFVSLVAALVVGALPHFGFAQSRSLIVPEAAVPTSQAPKPPAQASAPQLAAQAASQAVQPVKLAAAASAAAQASSGSQDKTAASRVSTAIATARDRAAPLAAAPTAPSASKPSVPSPVAAKVTAVNAVLTAATAADNSPPAPPVPRAGSAGPTVQRKADGSQVFRTPVTPSMLQEEQRVAAMNQPPAVASRPAGFAQQNPPQGGQPSQQPSALASFLGTTSTGLPKWATDGVTKTNGKTRLVVSQGVTEMVTIARNFPNRFITPFEAAEVVTTDENLAHDGVGGAVILSTASDKPIGIFIQDRYSDRSIGLVLMPEDVPQRELRLVLDETWTAPVLRPNPDQSQAQMPAAQNDFVEFLKSTLRAMAKGEVPDGHALTPVDPELIPRCQIPGLALKPAQMLDGPTTRIAVYVAANTTAGPVPFQEAGCYRKGVLAVSAFPRPVLEPGQSTEVYVVLRKEVATQTTTGKRRPVLVTQ